MNSTTRLVLLLSCAFAAFPATAGADVDVDVRSSSGTSLLISERTDNGPENVTVDSTATEFVVSDPGGAFAQGGCVQVDPTTATCPRGAEAQVSVLLEGGDDVYTSLLEPEDDLVFVRVETGAGDDIYRGGSNAEFVLGGSGDDLIEGNGGTDTLVGGPGDDRILGGPSRDFLVGEDGNDELIAFGGPDNLDGGEGDDRLDGGDGDDALKGEGGDDLLEGGAGEDSLGGGAGADILDGGADDDSLDGDNGDDRLEGGSGADEIDGGAGADELLGGSDDDVLTGASGDDTLDGGGGVNGFDCGAGTDLAYSTLADLLLPVNCDQRGAQVTVQTVGAELRLRKNGRVKRAFAEVPLACPATQLSACDGQLQMNNGFKPVSGKRRFTIEPGSADDVKVRFRPKIAKLLGRGKTVALTATSETGLPGGTTVSNSLLSVVG